MGWSWETTERFTRTGDTEPARFELRQVGDTEFELVSPFTYQQRDGKTIDVTDTEMGTTDLASVPWFMAWFVSSYGRHTPAALVHDQLTPGGNPPDEYSRRCTADRIFLQAMDDLEVPPVRSRVMWAAVVFATKWAHRPFGTLAMGTWLATSLVGTGLLALLLAARSPLALVALAGPFAGALLWDHRPRREPYSYWAGVVAGYGIWLTILPAVVSVAVHYLVYWPAEWVVQHVRRRIGGNRGQTIPGPLSYNEA